MRKQALNAALLALSLFQVATFSVYGSCAVSPSVLKTGERLSYQLFYNLGFIWIQAGTADFSIKRATWSNRPVWKLELIGRTQPSFDGFFTVRDTMITYVDSASLIPFKSYKYTHEDSWHGIDAFTFSPHTGGYSITTQLMRKGAWKPEVVDETKSCGFDLLSSIYRLRCMEGLESFKAGKKMEVPVRLDDGEYIVYLTYLGKENIKLHKKGSYLAHAFTLSLVAGKVFKRGDVLKMWISTDGNNIPLMVESPIRVGKLKAVFKEAQRTRYPVSVPLQ